jgi:hypothetical protein
MKRLREQQRMEKRRAKQARRRDRASSSSEHTPASEGVDVDPDIAHIVPGPQPLPWDEDGFAPED